MYSAIHLNTRIVCAHTALQLLYNENSGMDRGGCCCSPEEFALFQYSSNVSERLDRFQDQMCCCLCKGMQLDGDKQRLHLFTHVFSDY